jgi:hypothetical protein
VTDSNGSSNSAKCLLNKAKQGNGLTSTLGEKIINKIGQLEVNSYPETGLKTAKPLSEYLHILSVGLKVLWLGGTDFLFMRWHCRE